jgi:hypothetical protein
VNNLTIPIFSPRETFRSAFISKRPHLANKKEKLPIPDLKGKAYVIKIAERGWDPSAQVKRKSTNAIRYKVQKHLYSSSQFARNKEALIWYDGNWNIGDSIIGQVLIHLRGRSWLFHITESLVLCTVVYYVRIRLLQTSAHCLKDNRISNKFY